MRTIVLVGANPVPLTVHADVDPTVGRTSIAFAGNIPTALQSQIRNKLKCLFDSTMVRCSYEHPNWLDGSRTTISFEPSTVPVGPEVEAAVLAAIYEQLPFQVAPWAKDIILVGEFSLTGELLPLQNALAYAVEANKQKRLMIVPSASLDEVAVLPRPVYEVNDILDLQMLLGTIFDLEVDPIGDRWIAGPHRDLREDMLIMPEQRTLKVKPPDCVDMSEIKGQAHGKRALEISAAGGHNLLFAGPPGEGKSLLSKAMPGILPPLNGAAAVEVTQLRRQKGLATVADGLIGVAPFEIIDRNTTQVALLGGGSTSPRPGAISLANHGVLYFDEVHMAPKTTIEALRGPLEDGEVTVQRAAWTAKFPAKFIFLSSTNPCPCGWLWHKAKNKCRCTTAEIRKYQAKLSGPLLDRIPLIAALEPLDDETYRNPPPALTSKEIRGRVTAARKRADERGVRCNADIKPSKLRKLVELTASGLKEESAVVKRLSLSTRARDHLLRVALTIADLSGDTAVSKRHIAEAGKYTNREILFRTKGASR